MKKYELIKEFPGSPKLGEIVERDILDQYVSSQCIIFQEKDIVRYPEYWKEIDENAFGIKSFFTNTTLTVIMNGEGYTTRTLNDDAKIQSIVRLSDNQVFQIGDYVSLNKSWGEDNRITKITIKDNIPVFTIESDSGHWSNYNQPLSEWSIVNKSLVFKSDDKVDVFKGDSFYIVDIKTNEFKSWDKDCDMYIASHISPIRPDIRVFASKKNAEEYIKFHQKTLSLADVFEIYPQFKKRDPEQNTNHAEKLIKKVFDENR